MGVIVKICLAILAVCAAIVLLPIVGAIVGLLWNLIPPILLGVVIIIAPILLIGVLIGKFIN